MSVSHVPPTTPALHDDLLAELQKIIPAAFPDGRLDRTALLESLQLGDAPLPGFVFTWPGIDSARNEARAATTATLAPDAPASLGWETARDILIEGDNLQVLKLLKRGYSNSVKLVYIDPPYNTGETYTYQDNYAIPENEYLRISEQVDEQGVPVTSNIETVGRKHAPWLNYMFPRLVTSRHLLRRDGIIMVSIDNNEVHHLRMLLDAVFGSVNFVDMMTWQGGRKGDARFTASGQDYILIYARDLSFLKSLDTRWRERKTGLEAVYEEERNLLQKHGEDFARAQEELRSWYETLPEGNSAKQHSHYDRIDAGGVWTSDNSSSPNPRPNLMFEFKGHAPPENGWRYDRTTMEQLDRDGKLIYPTGRAKRIRIKRYLHEQETWAPASTFYKDRSGASSLVDSLVGEGVFDNPKSVEVLARLFGSMTGDGDLILDFFAGSGSTAHAVWEQNRADSKARRWILVQAPEKPDPKEASGKAAIAAGYKTIFEITAKRLHAASLLFNRPGGGSPALGFRVFRAQGTNLAIDPPLRADKDLTGDEYLKLTVERAKADPVQPNSDPMAVAWEVVLKATDTPLDAKLVPRDAGASTVLEFQNWNDDRDGGRLFVCLDSFTVEAGDRLSLTDSDTLILRGDKVDDATTLTLAPRLKSKLILLERVPREISL